MENLLIYPTTKAQIETLEMLLNEMKIKFDKLNAAKEPSEMKHLFKNPEYKKKKSVRLSQKEQKELLGL